MEELKAEIAKLQAILDQMLLDAKEDSRKLDEIIEIFKRNGDL